MNSLSNWVLTLQATVGPAQHVAAVTEFILNIRRRPFLSLLTQLLAAKSHRPFVWIIQSYNTHTHTHTHTLTLTHSVRLCVGCSVLWSLFTAEQLVEWISLHLLSSLTRTRTHTHTHTHKPSSSFYTLIIINVAVIITHPHRHHHVMVCVWRQMFVSVCECVCVFYRHLYTLPLCLHQTLYHLTQQ